MIIHVLHADDSDSSKGWRGVDLSFPFPKGKDEVDKIKRVGKVKLNDLPTSHLSIKINLLFKNNPLIRKASVTGDRLG